MPQVECEMSIRTLLVLRKQEYIFEYQSALLCFDYSEQKKFSNRS